MPAAAPHHPPKRPRGPLPLLALLNARAAGGRASRHEQALRQVLGQGVAWHTTHSLEEARQVLAQQAGPCRVLLMGGDGTVNGLLGALVAGGHELALLPLGSGNDTARALGLRAGWSDAAVRHAANAPARAMDLGEAQTEHGRTWFASSLAVGFDAAIAERAHHGPRWLAGLPRYLWATLREITHLRVSRLTIHGSQGEALHDGQALFASALNTPTYGAGMPMAPMARVDDGRLDLIQAGRFGRLGALLMLPRLMAGRHIGHPRVQALDDTAFDLHSDVPLALAADGEPLPRARHIRLRLRAAALPVVWAAAQ